jgi:hypothetical protein
MASLSLPSKVGGRLNSPALICPRLASADNPFIGMQRRGVSRQQMQDLAQSALRVGVELAGRCNGVGTETAERLGATIRQWNARLRYRE